MALPERDPGARRPFRADFILAAAIGIVTLAALVLAAMLWNGQRLHQQTVGTISISRAVRDEMLVLTQALAEAAETSRNPRRREAHAAAAASARAHAEALRAMTAPYPEIHAEALHISEMVERFLDPRRTDGAIHAELYEAGAHLRVMLNATNDAAREAENQARVRLTTMSTALAVLALIAGGLAALSLRRERAQWRLTHRLAEEARAKAAASDLAKTRFLAVASHDMRQPLHALMLYISALSRRVEGEEARSILARMERATRSMAGMFATLLDLARVQGGAVTPEIEDFPVQDVIDRIVAEHPGGAVEAAPSDLAARSDPALIERVLANLAANAIKHGGGKARIETALREGRVEISVVDQGPGIAPEDQERMFEEFVRLDARGGAEGLGLGLAIVKRIGALLDMPIKVQSAPGEGARFSITLPRAVAAPASAPSPAADRDALAGVAALVIDDDPLAREAVAGALRDMGADVRAGGGEEEAQATMRDGFAPALLVTDLRIDGQLRGIEIARRLALRCVPAPAVIVITGDTAPETLDMLRASGFAWLIKPVEPQHLSQTAGALIEAR